MAKLIDLIMAIFHVSKLENGSRREKTQQNKEKKYNNKRKHSGQQERHTGQWIRSHFKWEGIVYQGGVAHAHTHTHPLEQVQCKENKFLTS